MSSIVVQYAARRLLESSSKDSRVEEEVEPWIPPLKICALIVLFCLSAVFSGLNLGLMCLDANQLAQIVKMGSGSDADKEARQQAAWAKKILPWRQEGNMLLCTILMGNVMVNSYVPILLADFWNGSAAFITSTLIILVFGEILPQSLCYRHGLRIGATLVPLVIFVWYLLWPVTKPLALILDRAFGEEMGQVLDRSQLVALIEYQRKMAPHLLTEQEAKILHGSLDFSTMRAQNIMVSLSECFCLDLQAVINPGLCAAVAHAGFSRIPVLDRNLLHRKKEFAVIGLIHVKDLLLLEVEHDVPLKALLPLIGRSVFVVEDDMPLPELLQEFRKGANHFAVVRGLCNDQDCDPYFRHVGIVTLQDLLNTIVQEDVHEADGADNVSEVSSEPSMMFSNVRRFVSSTNGRAINGPSGVRPVRALTNDEVVAAAAFLRQRHMSLFGTIDQLILEAFIARECELVRGAPDGAAGFKHQLYTRGQAASFATLVITGEVKVFAGDEGHESIHGPWSLLAKRCLGVRASRSSHRETGLPSLLQQQFSNSHKAPGTGLKVLPIEQQLSSPSNHSGSRLPLQEQQNSFSSHSGVRYRPDFTACTAEDKDAISETRLLLITAEAYSRLMNLRHFSL